MRYTKTLSDDAARDAILRGVNKIYDPVRKTLGPSGSNVLLYGTFGRKSRITNDGVTVASVIEPKDPHERLVAATFVEAAKKTNERAGDGTTTTTVIAGKLINDVLKKFGDNPTIVSVKKTNPMDVRRQLLADAAKVAEKIKQKSTTVKDLKSLEQIASISVESEVIGKTIAKIVWEVGPDGHVDVVEGYKGAIETDVIRGMRFSAKVPAKVFINNPSRFEMVVEDSPVLVTNFVLDNVQEVGRMLNSLQQNGGITKIIIIAPKFSDAVLVEFVKANKAGFGIMPVLAPSLRTEQLDDISVFFGAKFINKDAGKKLSLVSIPDLGSVEKLVVKDVEVREDATALGGKGEKTQAVAERITLLKNQLKEARTELIKNQLLKRIGSLASAVGVIKVGAISDAETLYLKMKIDDAVYACKAAMEEGFVKGGGVCLREIANELADSPLAGALRAPHEQIVENAGEEITVGKTIIDPAKSTRLAVENAVSVAAHLLTVHSIVAEIDADDPTEAYHRIADALHKSADFYAKREGLVTEGIEEARHDSLAALGEGESKMGY